MHLPAGTYFHSNTQRGSVHNRSTAGSGRHSGAKTDFTRSTSLMKLKKKRSAAEEWALQAPDH